MEIYLVRHTIPAISPGICYGQTDLALSADFESHAKEVIRKIPDDADAVFSSPLLRCTRLAAIIPCSLPFQTDHRLLEMNIGVWEMKSWNAISPEEPWFADYINIPVPGGESYQHLYDRVSDFLNSLKDSRVQKAIIVTHGGVIRAAIAAITHVSLQSAMKTIVPFGSSHYYTLTDSTL